MTSVFVHAQQPESLLFPFLFEGLEKARRERGREILAFLLMMMQSRIHKQVEGKVPQGESNSGQLTIADLKSVVLTTRLKGLV